MTFKTPFVHCTTRMAFVAATLLFVGFVQSRDVRAGNWTTQLIALEAKVVDVKKHPHPIVNEAADLDHMIGQMVMVGFHGTKTKTNTVQHIAKLIKDGTIGGVIIMARNVKNKKQLRKLNGSVSRGAP